MKMLQRLLCAKTDLHIRLFILQSANCLIFVNQLIKIQFNRIEHFIIGHSAITIS